MLLFHSHSICRGGVDFKFSMHPFEEQLSVINPPSMVFSQASPNNSIIYELNLLHADCPVEHAESFLYALPSPVRPKRHPRLSIHEEIKEENRLLERKLSQLHHGITSRPRAPALSPEPAKPSAATENKTLLKLEEQYLQSKIVKHYNLIMKELPACRSCHAQCAFLARNGEGVVLRCGSCAGAGSVQPLMGVLYDLENRGRFEEETAALQAALNQLDEDLARLHREIQEGEQLRERLLALKGAGRRKFREISECKFYLRKHLSTLRGNDMREIQRLMPGELLQQMEQWSAVANSAKWKEVVRLAERVMPAYLRREGPSKLLANLQKLLNYQPQQAVQISVSQHVRFPLQDIQSAVFVVDGSYALPVLPRVKHLTLQFQHKKTHRELTLLFDSLPRQMDSLTFRYDHRAHSHISAETFPFLQAVANLPLSQLTLKLENLKDFADLLRLPTLLTPKRQLSLQVSAHPFARQPLRLPRNYYQQLLNSLGEVVILEVDLPQGADSPAEVDWHQLASARQLCSVKIGRGKRAKSEKEMVAQGVVQRLVASRAATVRMIRQLESRQDSPDRSGIELMLASVLAFLP